jgi:DNA-binding transcriptional LysR family regulator
VEPGPSLRELRCFALVAQHLSFSRAAAGSGRSQPAISQAISRLERSLGVRLFDRTSREVRLSAAGQALLPYADGLLGAAEALAAEAARLAVPARQTIRLAYPPLVGALAAQVARRLARRQPAIEVELRAAGWSAATAGLAGGDIPAAILSAPFPDGFATTARFSVTVTHLAVPAGDPIAARPRIRLEQLAGYQVILPRNRPPGGMWARLAAQLRGPHQHRVVADEIEDFGAMLDLVAAGAGLLPTPQLLAETIRRQDVRFIPLDAGDLRMTYGLAWSPEHTSAELMALIHAVQATLRAR